MAMESINVGTTANDKKGDSLRLAFQKVNANFADLYSSMQTKVTQNPPTSSKGAAGDKAGDIAVEASNLYYCIDNYTNGTLDIWKRVTSSNDTW
jgi:hypothetical protein